MEVLEIQKGGVMQDAKTLKPCPFCGGEAYYLESVNGSRMVYAGCSACGVAQKAQLIYTPQGDSPTKDVVAAWNRRVPDHAALEEITNGK